MEYPIYIRHSCLSSYPGYAAPPHWHDDIEFIIILKGGMTYNVNGKLIDLASGEGIFVNSRQMHFGSLASQIAFVQNLFLAAMTIGLSMFAAQYWGKGEKKEVEKMLAELIILLLNALPLFFNVHR